METETAIVKEEKRVPVEYKNGMVDLKSLDEAYRFARFVVASGMSPLKTPESVIVAIQYGSEVGLKPMQAIQNIAVINGRPGLYGKALPGVVQARGLLASFEEHWEGKGDDWTAICHVERKDGQTRTERFSWAQAKKAGLDKKPGPWQQYPDLMLRYRARGLAFNALFADCLCGLGVVEELRDYPTRRPDIAESVDPILEEIK